jgi:hypothetical protein
MFPNLEIRHLHAVIVLAEELTTRHGAKDNTKRKSRSPSLARAGSVMV